MYVEWFYMLGFRKLHYNRSEEKGWFTVKCNNERWAIKLTTDINKAERLNRVPGHEFQHCLLDAGWFEKYPISNS